MPDQLNVETSAIELADVTVRIPKEMHQALRVLADHLAAWNNQVDAMRAFSFAVGLRFKHNTQGIGVGLTIVSGLFAEGIDIDGEEKAKLIDQERMACLGGLCAGVEAQAERTANDAADSIVDEYHPQDRPLEKERAKKNIATAYQAAYMASFNSTRQRASIMTVDVASKFKPL